jgi:hypothetical protein
MPLSPFRVYTRGHVDIPSHRLGSKQEDPGWKDPAYQSKEVTTESSQQNQRYPSVGIVPGSKEVCYYFEIG